MTTTPPRLTATSIPWQRRLRREIGWALLGKLAALIVLWALFFSPSHRLQVDGDVAAGKLALEAPAAEPATSRLPDRASRGD